jgi:hypothetical protein
VVQVVAGSSPVAHPSRKPCYGGLAAQCGVGSNFAGAWEPALKMSADEAARRAAACVGLRL